MKTRIMIGALIAATLAPAVTASAQTAALRRDRQDIRAEQRDVRHEQRDLRDARRYGDRRDVRDERGDVREQRGDVRDARREYREDWRDYRNSHRDLYRGQTFRAPFRYQRFGVGGRIAPAYWGNQYRVNDVSRWNLPQAGRNLVYVRHYNDLLLVNSYTGRVVRVYNGFYW